MSEKYPGGVFKFIVRVVLGIGVILMVNYLLAEQDVAISVGVNAVSALTSGVLGFPGIGLLYGIVLYQNL